MRAFSASAIALVLSLIAPCYLNQASAANLGSHHHNHHGRSKRQTDLACKFTDIKGMLGTNDQTIEQYCRCSDGSYGHECEQRFVNPCAGNSVQFFNVPENLSPRYYIHCAHGEPNLFKCPAFLVWDDELLTCGVRYARGSAGVQYDSFYNRKQVKEMYPGGVVVTTTQAEQVQYHGQESEEGQYGQGGQLGQFDQGMSQGGLGMDQQGQVVGQQRPNLNGQEQGLDQQRDMVTSQQGMGVNLQEMNQQRPFSIQQGQETNQQMIKQQGVSQQSSSQGQGKGMSKAMSVGKELDRVSSQHGQGMDQQFNSQQFVPNSKQGMGLNQQEMNQAQNQQVNGGNQPSFSQQQGQFISHGQGMNQGMGLTQVSTQQVNAVKQQLVDQQGHALNQQLVDQQTHGMSQQDGSLKHQGQVSSQKFVNQINEQSNNQKGQGSSQQIVNQLRPGSNKAFSNQQGQVVSQQSQSASHLGMNQQVSEHTEQLEVNQQSANQHSMGQPGQVTSQQLNNQQGMNFDQHGQSGGQQVVRPLIPGSNRPSNNQQTQSVSQQGMKQQQLEMSQHSANQQSMGQPGQVASQQFEHRQGLTLNQQGLSQQGVGQSKQSSIQHGHALNQIQRPTLRPTVSENEQFLSQVNSDRFSQDKQAFLNKAQQQTTSGKQNVNQHGLLEQLNNMIFNKQQYQAQSQSGQLNNRQEVTNQEQAMNQQHGQVVSQGQGMNQQGLSQQISSQQSTTQQVHSFDQQRPQFTNRLGVAQQGMSVGQHGLSQQGQVSSHQFTHQGQGTSQQGLAQGMNQQSTSQQGMNLNQQGQSFDQQRPQFTNGLGVAQQGMSQQSNSLQGQGHLSRQGMNQQSSGHQGQGQGNLIANHQASGHREQGSSQLNHNMNVQSASHLGPRFDSNQQEQARPKFPTLPTQTQSEIFDYVKNRIESIMSNSNGATKATRPMGAQLDASISVKQAQTLSNVLPVEPFSSQTTLDQQLNSCGLEAQLQVPLVFQVTMKSPLGSEATQSQLAQVFQFLQQQSRLGIHVLLTFPPSE